jgi:hypothetical protein
MKKTFDLRPEGKHPDRVLEALKNELSKYMKRERRRDLPAGADFWDFDCKVGADEASAEVSHPNALRAKIDALVQGGAEKVYVELLVKPATRQRWAESGERTPSDADDAGAFDDDGDDSNG